MQFLPLFLENSNLPERRTAIHRGSSTENLARASNNVYLADRTFQDSRRAFHEQFGEYPADSIKGLKHELKSIEDNSDYITLHHPNFPSPEQKEYRWYTNTLLPMVHNRLTALKNYFGAMQQYASQRSNLTQTREQIDFAKLRLTELDDIESGRALESATSKKDPVVIFNLLSGNRNGYPNGNPPALINSHDDTRKPLRTRLHDARQRYFANLLSNRERVVTGKVLLVDAILRRDAHTTFDLLEGNSSNPPARIDAFDDPMKPIALRLVKTIQGDNPVFSKILGRGKQTRSLIENVIAIFHKRALHGGSKGIFSQDGGVGKKLDDYSEKMAILFPVSQLKDKQTALAKTWAQEDVASLIEDKKSSFHKRKLTAQARQKRMKIALQKAQQKANEKLTGAPKTYRVRWSRKKLKAV